MVDTKDALESVLSSGEDLEHFRDKMRMEELEHMNGYTAYILC